jgi:hypothetical protein
MFKTQTTYLSDAATWKKGQMIGKDTKLLTANVCITKSLPREASNIKIHARRPKYENEDGRAEREKKIQERKENRWKYRFTETDPLGAKINI